MAQKIDTFANCLSNRPKQYICIHIIHIQTLSSSKSNEINVIYFNFEQRQCKNINLPNLTNNRWYTDPQSAESP